ncbi:DUF6421 family protein [Agrococcus baldri]|uniref:Uncharacterized protein n=1 Tax=Agrococcus baldri TaxID=153730 RepID=A0AA87URQ9_9MICO|nr:DUF6421 family protein [Agrococcus baldri]GEK80221.1 hypothetical protein ABA31_15720 [Agrococcus baldri]
MTMTQATAADLRQHSAWLQIKAAATALQPMQSKNGAIEEVGDHDAARAHVTGLAQGIRTIAPEFPHDAAYLEQAAVDFERWAEGGFGEPDFFDALVQFQPQQHRVDGLKHLVIFPMYTQNGSSKRLVEAVLVEVIWPEFIAELEAGDYSNALFVPLRFIDFTAGYDTNSAVLFPETVAMREIPSFTWGAIFQDREAARFRRVVEAACEVTKLELPADAAELVADQRTAEETFVMWDLIHDRTHMRGDLPFDPFMIKQRMPFFLYSLEELRCDLTAFRESVAIERRIAAKEDATDADRELAKHAKHVQYAVIFDRIFRFAITGTRTRNYDGLGGQLLFAWLHQHRVLHWTDTQLAFDWDEVPDVVNKLGEATELLYWRSIDRPKVAHWLAAYELVSSVVEPHPASKWKAGELPLDGAPRQLTDLVMDDEFPLSMFYEAFEKKMREVIASTSGITAESA